MFLSESLMFEGRLSKTGWQRLEFEPNNPKFIKKRGTWLTIRLYWMMDEMYEVVLRGDGWGGGHRALDGGQFRF